MNHFTHSIGNIIRTERKLQNITLSEASEKTGVSKAMLAQIERGESSPTISTIWKISTGLHIPMATLLAQEKTADYKVNKLSHIETISDLDGHIRIYNLFPFDPFSALDYLYIEMDPNTKYFSTGHVNAQEEYVVVTHGNLNMHIGSRVFPMEKGDSITFNGDEEHAYENVSDEIVIFQTLMRY